ncbi:hypothetical protein JX266_006465 [Neoarthrinium moseri]|uniref:uncharacterized protein n=1 Tax=Neoarthrinium moseri TaxID=1658444 RepID=UPI001FDB0A16|nr:uncharacterized protein JN550_007030 [Neoarthrinium moseri]KAI1847613.1 hypothetical protein JX266_006465 [Neoarthrinium moseri]KAI1867299.1 hypothetical protein JN550_007030 [Neoarthrinium moseri]
MENSHVDAEMLKEILNLEIPLEPQLSPDCKSVVYTTRLKWHHKIKEHVSEPLHIVDDVSCPKSSRKLTDGLFYDRMPRWSPQPHKRSIAFLSDRGGQRGKSVALHLLDLDTAESKPRPITAVESERTISKFCFSPDGRFIAYISTAEKSAEAKAKYDAKDDAFIWGQWQDWDHTHLYLVDLETAAIELAFDKNCSVVDFAWSEGSDRIAVVTHRTPHIESHYLHGATLFILDLASRETREAAHFSGSLSSIVWSGQSLYFVACSVPHEDTSGFVVYSMQVPDSHGIDASISDATDIRKVYMGNGNSCAISLLQINGDVIVKTQRGMSDELLLLGNDTVLLRSQGSSIRHFDARRNSNNRIVLTYTVGDVNNPTEVFCECLSLGKRDIKQLSVHGAAFQSMIFGHCKFIECPSLDGCETIEGIYLTPAHLSTISGTGSVMTQLPLPTLVVLHGGPYSRHTNDFDIWHPLTFLAPLLLLAGYGILMPNYRGSSGRGQCFASYSRGGMGLYDEPDIVAMTQHAIELGLANKQRLVVGGWSQGGYLSYLSAVRNGTHGLGWRFSGAICGAGVTDWDAMAMTSDIGYEQAQFAGHAPWRGESRHVHVSGSAIREFPAAAREGRIPPLLILHGEQDERVPVSQAHGFRRALDEAGLMSQTEFVT